LKRPRKAIGRLTARGRTAIHRLGQRLPWYASGDSVEGRNLRNLYTETTWFGVLNGLSVTFVSVYALRLGASTAQMGWLAALPALVNVVWLVPAARIIERQRKRVPIMVLTGLLQRLGYLALALMPFFVITGRVQALIAINTLIALPTAIINTSITSLIPDLTVPERRGQVVSVRWLILSAVATLAALVGGKVLDLITVPLNYQILLGVGTVFSLIGLGYLRRIQVPDAMPNRRGVRRRRRGVVRRLRQSLAQFVSERGFTRFTVAAFVFYWGLYLPAALWSVIRVRDLGASDAWIGIIALVVNAATIGGYFFWGKVQAKRGDRWVLIVTACGVAAYSLLTALVPTIAWMIPTSILGGLAWSGCNLALFNVLLGVSPSEHRPTYVALYTALMNVTAFAAPLLGAALSDWAGIRTVFVVAGAVRLAGALFFLRLVR
jgi:MFS family permease